MAESILISFSLIILIGIGAEWLGWRFRFPALILFLIFGFIVGPVFGLIKTDALLGNLLSPLVSVSVAIILFEGGLNLKLSELASVGKTVRNLITIGVLVCWIIISLAAHFVLGFNIKVSLLLGAILVVTGPTAIGPLLKHMQLVGRLGSIVRWEGIMIAPAGALLAVLVFEGVVLAGALHEATGQVVMGIIKTVAVGSFIGTIGGVFLTVLIKKNWLPDFLHSPAALMMVILVHTGSNLIQTRAGLLAVTIMGIALANQKLADIRPIVKFKEDLRVLLIPSLFILLAARLRLEDLQYINLDSFIFLFIVFVIARPVAVLLSTLNQDLNWKEIFFLSWLGPRGIVAAAVSSVFALYLEDMGFAQTEVIVPITFFVIICTVTIVGLTASPLANYLKLSNPDPQGILFLGAHVWARSIALVLQEEGFKTFLVDSNRENITNAKLAGLPAYNGNILSESIGDRIDFMGIGKLVCLTFNDEVNSLAALHFSDIFSKNDLYQLSPEEDEDVSQKNKVAKELQGRILFEMNKGYLYINRKIYFGSSIKKTKLTKDFDFEAFKNHYGDKALPLILITENKKILMFTIDKELTPKPGQTLISLVDQVEE